MPIIYMCINQSRHDTIDNKVSTFSEILQKLLKSRLQNVLLTKKIQFLTHL
jgi:hypothetical protein